MKKLLSLILIVAFFINSNAVFAALVVTDGTTNTFVDVSANGTPLVNIAAPNETGLSHNKYTDFNVDEQNLIMNNSKELTGVSQLGGYVIGNSNLISAGREANVILNEVTSNRVSDLRGYIEVYGKAADFVLANPNGINVAGVGFLNTSRIGMVTGTPQIVDGMIDNFAMSQTGAINVTGRDAGGVKNLGLDLQNIDYASLVSRIIKISGEIYAKNLDLLAGNDKYDYKNKTITSKAADKPAGVEFGIDSSVFGGMYAGRINLIATENGFGVRTLSDLVSTVDDITINSAGDIEYKTVKSNQNVNIKASGDITNTEETTAVNNINVDGKNIKSGKFYAGENINLTTSENATYEQAEASQDVNVKAGGDITNTAETIAVNNINIDGKNIKNGNFYAGEYLKLTTVDDAIFGIAEASQNIDINAGGALSNTNRTVSEKNINITAKNVTAGKFYAGENVNITTTENATYAQAEATQNVTVTAGGDITNTDETTAINKISLAGKNISVNDLTVGTDIELKATGNINNTGTVYAAQDIFVTGADLTNHGEFTAFRDLDFTTRDLTNYGDIQSGNNLNLTTRNVNNQAGSFLYSGADMILDATENILNSGEITAVGNINLTAASEINFLASSKLGANGNVNISGYSSAIGTGAELLTGGDLIFDLTHNFLNSGEILANKINFDVDGNFVNNYKIFTVADNLTVNAGQIDNNINGELSSGSGVILNSTVDLNNNGSVEAAVDAVITAGGNVTSTNKILAVKNVSVSAKNVIGGKYYAGENVNITTTENASYEQAEANQNVTVKAGGDITNIDETTAVNKISLDGKNIRVNDLTSGTDIDLKATENVNNTGTIYAAQDIFVSGADLTNHGDITAFRDLDFTIRDLANYGNIQSGNNLNLTTRNINNQAGGFLYAGADMILDATENILNSGEITAVRNINLTAANEINFLANSKLGANGNVNISGYSSAIGTGAELLAGGDLIFDLTHNFLNSGEILANKINFNVDENFVNNYKIFTVADNLTVNAGQIDNSGQLSSGSELILTADTNINNSGVLEAEANVALTAGENVTNTNKISAVKNVNVAAKNVIGGKYYAGESVDITTSENVSYERAEANQNVTVKAGGDITNTDATIAVNKISLDGKNISVKNLTAGTDINLKATADLKNEGTVYAYQDIFLNTGTIILLSPYKYIAARDLTVNAQNLTNIGEFSASRNLTFAGLDVNNYGKIQSGINLNFNTRNMINYAGGYLYSGGNITIGATQKILNSGEISAIGNIGLTATDEVTFLDNSKLSTNNGVNVSANFSEVRTGAKVLAGGNIVFNLTNSLLNLGKILGDKIDLTLGGTFMNASEVLTDSNNLTVNAARITNTATGKFNSGAFLNFNAADIHNDGIMQALTGINFVGSRLNNFKEIYSNGDVNISLNDWRNNNQEISAYNNLNLYAANSITNNSSIGLLANNDLILQTNNFYNNLDAYVYSGRDSFYKIGNLLQNDRGLMYATRSMVIRGSGDDNSWAGRLFNYAGDIMTRDGDLTIKAGAVDNVSIDNYGSFAEAGAYTIVSSNVPETGAYLSGGRYGVRKWDFLWITRDIDQLWNALISQGIIDSTGHPYQANGAPSGVIDYYEWVYVRDLGTNFMGLGAEKTAQIVDQIKKFISYDSYKRRYYDMVKWDAVSNIVANKQGKILAGSDIYISGTTLTNHSSIITAQNNFNVNVTNLYNEKPNYSLYYQDYFFHYINDYHWSLIEGGPLYTTETLYSNTPAVLSGRNVYITATNKVYNDQPSNDVFNITQNRGTINKKVETVQQTGVLDPLAFINSGTVAITNPIVDNSNLYKAVTTLNVGSTKPSITDRSLANPKGGTATIGIVNLHTTIPSIATPVITDPTTAIMNPNIQPGAGFKIAAPDTGYLFQTSNRFLNENAFIGSNYFYERLGYNPDKAVTKFMGDAVYEQKIIQDAIVIATGKMYLDDKVKTMNEQMMDLYDNAIKEQSKLGLANGQDLTKEQIDNLETDIVWYVQRKIGDEVVLVPMVYLCANTKNKIDTSSNSRIQAVENVSIKTGDVVNSGTIKAKNVFVEANNDISNIDGTIYAADSLGLTAGGNIRNISTSMSQETGKGRAEIISAGDLMMEAGNTIELRAATIKAGNNASIKAKDIKVTTGVLSNTTNTGTTSTNVGSQIIVGKNLQMNSARDTTVEGSEISANGNASINAGGNIKVSSVNYGNVNKITEEGKIVTGGNLSLTAGKTIELKAASVATGKDLAVKAKDIVVGTVVVEDTHRIGGHDDVVEKIVTNLGSSISVGGNAKIESENDTTIAGSDVAIGGNANIKTGGSLNIVSVEDSYEKETIKKSKSGGVCGVGEKTKVEITKESSTTQVGSSFSVGGNMTADIGKDMLVAASDVAVGGNADIMTKGDINIISKENTYSKDYSMQEEGFYSGASETDKIRTVNQVGSSFTTGGNMSLSAKNDITVQASLLGTEAGSMTLNAGNDVNLLSAENSYSRSQTKEKSNYGGIEKSESQENWNTTTQQASYALSGNNIKINAGKDFTMQASVVSAAGDGEIKAGGDINILSAENVTETSKTTSSSSNYGVQSNGTEEKEWKKTTENVGSGLNIGGNLTASADGDINIKGSDVAVGGDIGLSATDVNIEAAVNREEYGYEKTKKSSGMDFNVEFTNGSMDTTYAKTNENTKYSGYNNESAKESSIGSGGKLTITSKNDTNIIGSTIMANEAEIEAGGDVNIKSKELKQTSYEGEKKTETTIGTSVGNAYVDTYNAGDALVKAEKAVEKAKSDLAEMERKQAEGKATSRAVEDAKANLGMATVNLVTATMNFANSVGSAATAGSTSMGTGFYGSGYARTSGSETRTDATSITNYGSSLYTNGNLSIKSKSGSINQTGSTVYAETGDITYSAADINIKSSQDTFSQKTVGSNYNVEGSYGSNGLSGSVGAGELKSSASGVTNNNSVVKAGAGKISMQAEDTVNIIGGNVSSKDVEVSAKNLNIESVQDEYYSNNSSINGGFGGGGGSANVSFGTSSGYVDSAWVGTQSGIDATGKVNIKVEDKTNLKGGVINSQTNDLTLETGSLTYEDINNYTYGNQTGFSVSVSAGSGQESDREGTNPRGTATVGMTNTGTEQEGITRATIGGGEIKVSRHSALDAESTDGLTINRDMTKREEKGEEITTGALDGSMSVDLRVFTEGGRESIGKDFKDLGKNIEQIGKGLTNNVVVQSIKNAATDENTNIVEAVQDYIRDDKKVAEIQADKKTTAELNGMTNQDSDGVTDTLQKTADIAGKDGGFTGDVKVYNNNDTTKGYSYANGDENTVGVNTKTTDLTNSGDVINTVFHETTNKDEHHAEGNNDQTAINRGNTAEAIWDLKNFGNENTNTMTNSEWNSQNAGSLTMLTGNIRAGNDFADAGNNIGILDFRLLTKEEGQKIADVAKTWVGTPYASKKMNINIQYIGENAQKGVAGDCSGTTHSIYEEAGFSYPYVPSGGIVNSDRFKAVSEPQVGDVGYTPGHVVIYDPKAQNLNSNKNGNIWTTHTKNGALYGADDKKWFGSGNQQWYRYDIPDSE